MIEVFHPVSYQFRSAENSMVTLTHEQVVTNGGYVQSFPGEEPFEFPVGYDPLGFELSAGLILTYNISTRTLDQDSEYDVTFRPSLLCWHHFLYTNAYLWVVSFGGAIDVSGHYVTGAWDESGAEVLNGNVVNDGTFEIAIVPGKNNKYDPFEGDVFYSTSYCDIAVGGNSQVLAPPEEIYNHVVTNDIPVNKYKFPGFPTMLSTSHAVFHGVEGVPMYT